MKKSIILILVSFAMLMEAIDTTIINTAIPMMAQSLKIYAIDLKLALITYLLSLAIFIPISGWIADKYGIKRVFICSIILFTLSSIACGFSRTLAQLMVARFIQGLGGSLTLPIGRLIIIRTYERHELLTKMSAVVMIASIGMMLGPVLGGIITTHFSWPWVFWVNVPFGLCTALLSYYLLPDTPPIAVHPLDKLGFILFGSGLATLVYSLSAFSESQTKSSQSMLALAVSLSLLAAYTWHSRHQKYPIVKVFLLKIRTFRISVLGNLCARLGFGGVPFLLPILFQIGLGCSPQLSGLLLAPTAFGVLMVKPMSVYILRWMGYKKLLLLNTLSVGISLWLFIFIKPGISVYVISAFTFIYGFFIALQYTAMNSLAYANLDPSDLSSANSIMSTIQQLTQSFGVAFAALLVNLFSQNIDLTPKTTIIVFHEVFFTMGLATFLSLIIFMKLEKRDGQELIEVPMVS